MNSPEMEAVLETARVQARSIANQIISSAKTVDQRIAALRAIAVMTEELLAAIQTTQAEVEAEMHVNSGGELQ